MTTLTERLSEWREKHTNMYGETDNDFAALLSAVEKVLAICDEVELASTEFIRAALAEALGVDA